MKPNWFVGLPVAAEPWLSRLVADAPDDLRLFHPEDLHATVAFLGGCGPERARRAWEEVHRLEGSSFSVSLGGLKAMGNPRRPSALSVVVDQGHPQAVALIESLRGPMIEVAGARPDPRPVLPHITVARVERKASACQRRAALAWVESKAPVGAELTIDRICLYTWAENRPIRQFRKVEQRLLDGRPR
jgi:2'-5' RNA ligase